MRPPVRRPGALVIEAASNDGYMLKRFVEHGVPVLGVDPARGPAEAAERAGVPTLCAFFDAELAERLASEGKQADVILGNNVLNLVSDLAGAVTGETINVDGGICESVRP